MIWVIRIVCYSTSAILWADIIRRQILYKERKRWYSVILNYATYHRFMFKTDIFQQLVDNMKPVEFNPLETLIPSNWKKDSIYKDLGLKRLVYSKTKAEMITEVIAVYGGEERDELVRKMFQ